MKRMTIPAVLTAGALAFTLAGCSGGQQQISEDNLKGLWGLESQSSLGFEAYVQFEDDQYAELLIADSWFEGSYSASGTEASIVIDDDESNTAKLTLSNGKLTMGSSDGSKLVFVKDSDENATIDDKLALADDGLLDLSEDGELGEDGETASTDLTSAEDDEGLDEDFEDYTWTVDDIGPIVVADDDKVAISITGKGTDSMDDPGYRMSVTNKTDKAIFVMPDDTFKVGDREIESGFVETIEPGQTVETFMYFDHEELGGGADLLAAIDGVVYVGDDDTGDEIATYSLHID